MDGNGGTTTARVLEGARMNLLHFGYDLFEGHTLVPILEKFSKRFGIGKPIVVADAGLLNKSNLEHLQDHGYEFILGARIKNESERIRQTITAQHWSDGKSIRIDKGNGLGLIVSYSDKRACKDAHSRESGLKRLEKKVKIRKTFKSQHQ